MAHTTVWWLLAGAIVAVELLTGTFYLLMIALGFVAAALAAHLGGGLVLQLIIAAVAGGGAVMMWHLKRDRSRTELPAQANTNVNMDIGETVQVVAWDQEGTASVQYRGTQWTVFHRSGVSPTAGSHRVVEVVGNRFLVEKS